MQWTLRSMLLVTAGIGYLVVGATTFGIAATVVSVVILGVAWFMRSRIKNDRQRLRRALTHAGVTLAAFYVGTFVTFRVFRTFEFTLAPPGDPQHNIVIFSLNPTAQELARQAYSPLIKWIPCHCAYPTGEQMKLLNHHPYTGEPFTLCW